MRSGVITAILAVGLAATITLCFAGQEAVGQHKEAPLDKAGFGSGAFQDAAKAIKLETGQKDEQDQKEGSEEQKKSGERGAGLDLGRETGSGEKHAEAVVKGPIVSE